MEWQTMKLGVVIIISEAFFIILFGAFVRFEHTSRSTKPEHGNVTGNDGHAVDGHAVVDGAAHVQQYYAFYQDIHIMVFIGFGFLMTFLKKYGFSSIGLNFLVATSVKQWATLVGGWIRHFSYTDNKIHIDLNTLIGSDFASAAVLITFGALLGKVSAIQLIVLSIFEVVFFAVNEYICFDKLLVTDVGDSMTVHTFGAYFGLAVARVIYKDIEQAKEKEGSVYHSDLFAMIGTIFLWLFWPSFNAAAAVGDGQLRALVNTYYSLTACAVVAFAVSSLLNKSKFDMVHIQNATLAGGVAIGTICNLRIEPWGALIVGSLAATISVFGYHYLTPLLAERFKIHDTCGVNNLHGMPGILAGLGGIVTAGLATRELYGPERDDIFTDTTRSAGTLAGYQAAALVITILISVVGGIITGFILKLPIWDQPKGDEIFDDKKHWLLPPDATAVEVNSDQSDPGLPKPDHMSDENMNGIQMARPVEHKSAEA